MKWFFLALCSVFFPSVSVGAEGQRFGTNQLELVILHGFNHVKQDFAVVSNNVAYHGELTVTSDSEWLKPAWNATRGQVELTLITSNFVASQTATVRIVSSSSTNEGFVHGTVAPMNLLRLV